MKTKKKESKHSHFVIAKEYRLYVIFGVIIILFAFTNKSLFIISIFFIADVFRCIFRYRINNLPLDTSFYFGVLASFFCSPLIGVSIHLIGLGNRLAFGQFEERHVSKTFRVVLIYFSAPFLRGLPFLSAAIILMVINEILAIVIGLLLGKRGGKEMIYYIVHFSIALLSFHILSFLEVFL